MAAKRIGGRIYSENIRNVAPKGTTPFVRAIPFIAEPIACSRIPKWKLRPPRSSEVNEEYSFRLVSVDGAKSAAPPIRLGKLPATALSTLPDAIRVASLPSAALNTGNLSFQPFGNSPATAASYSAANSGNLVLYSANRSFHFFSVTAPFAPFSW